jgi:hypothetical protein
VAFIILGQHDLVGENATREDEGGDLVELEEGMGVRDHDPVYSLPSRQRGYRLCRERQAFRPEGQALTFGRNIGPSQE